MLTHLPLFQTPMRSFHGSHARTAVTGKRGGIPLRGAARLPENRPDVHDKKRGREFPATLMIPELNA